MLLKGRVVMQNNSNSHRQFFLDVLLKITNKLFPDKKVEIQSREIRIGNNGSLAINERGQYFDHEAGSGGIISLVMKTQLCGFKKALEWCDNLQCLPTSTKQYAPAQPKQNDAKERTAKALQHWCIAKNIKGTLGEQYFRVHRGITIELPGSLKFIPQMWHSKGVHYPAIIAGVLSADKRFLGIHLIYLDPSTGNKIDDNKPKISFGPVAGGAVKLLPLKDTLAITEGVEDGLSVLESNPGFAVWACLGTAGLRNVEIPKTVKEVIIAADNDSAGLKAAYAKKDKLLALGHSVSICIPKGCKDFNDLLRRKSNV